MMHISILIPKAAILGSLEGTRQLFTQVNQVCKMRGMPPLFNVQLVGLEKATPAAGGLYTVNADVLLQDIKKTNLIIIPAIDGELKSAIDQNSAFIPWIIRQYKGGAEVASLCLGAFLLASTGLLKGRKVATHWGAANEFRKMFPDVELITERIITEEQGIYSSGGAFSYLNLILHLIDKYAGHDMAVLCAKIFAIEIERENQASFIIFQGQKEHDDEPVKKAQEYIESNYQDKTTVDELAGMFAIGRRSFERRFKKATDNTVAEYIQRVKVEAAKKELEASRKTVNEIMYEVGYSDIKAFRTTFKKITGLSPLEYKHKYNKDAMAMA
ncbi:MAG: helix-turn-helix domain-containing protein [Bacteroidetes bacterium]|nr:helix-turn-helix domain-containing protein [Bacteroidota bacterium]